MTYPIAKPLQLCALLVMTAGCAVGPDNVRTKLMTNGMIFGLIVSTGLTLFVIPLLYVVMVEKAGMKVRRTENESFATGI